MVPMFFPYHRHGASDAVILLVFAALHLGNACHAGDRSWAPMAKRLSWLVVIQGSVFRQYRICTDIDDTAGRQDPGRRLGCRFGGR